MTSANNITPVTISDVASEQNRRLYQRERRVVPRAQSSQALDGNVPVGVIDDGHAFVYDFALGAYRPSAPQNIPFSWPGPPAAGNKSGPHLALLPNFSRIYVVTLAIATTAGGSTIVEFFLNGTLFSTLTLPGGQRSIYKRNPNDGSWPTCGANDTDYFQVQCTTAGGGSDLVAAIRIV